MDYGTYGAASISTASQPEPLQKSVKCDSPSHFAFISKLTDDASLKAAIRSRSKSKAPLGSRIRAEASETPLQIFKSLIDQLVQGRIPGPRLLRLNTEFESVDQGRTFEVLCISQELEHRVDSILLPRDDGQKIRGRVCRAGLVRETPLDLIRESSGAADG